MKRIYIFVFAVLFSVLSAFSQIGIRTDFPKALLHIDGKGDNPNGSLSDAELSNDVILSSSGKLGVGVLNPQKRLEIVNDPAITGLDYGLKLTPGYGGPSILTLETDGVTNKWEANPSLGKIGYFTAEVAQTFAYRNPQRLKLISQGGDVSLTNKLELRVPTEGRYLFTITVIGLTKTVLKRQDFNTGSLYVYLTVNDTLDDSLENSVFYSQIGDKLLDVVEIYEPINLISERDNGFPAYMSLTTSLYAGYCKPSDYLMLRISPTIGLSTTNNTTPSDDVFEITPDCKVMITIYNI